MPAIEDEDLNQTAVLWPWTGVDAYNEPTRGEPEEIDVRWNTKRREVTGPTGTPMALDATVIVAQSVVVGSLLMLSALEDVVGTGNPNAEVMQVMSYSETPDLRGIEVRREVGLVRFRGTLPEYADG